MIDEKKLQAVLAPYRVPDLKRSVWQMINSFVPYVVLWYLMYLSVSVSYWLTLALAVPTAGFMVRIFIIFHDCGHGSFFNSSRANNFWGMVTGFLVYTPYYGWRHAHAVHHATAGNLDKKGTGDVWTMTVEEYRNASTGVKLGYRIYRNPLILFTIGSVISFLFINRFFYNISNKKDRFSIHATNLAVVCMVAGLILLMGLNAFLFIQLSILLFATSFGVWLFYLQHNFEDVYWERDDKWDRVKSALEGSSFYKLPKVLQWFSGNIGFHHIHHLNPGIPNYKLEKCYKENPYFQEVKPITLLSGFKSFSLRLYDEETHKMVGYPSKT